MPIDIHFFVSELNRLEIFPSQKFTPFTDKLSSYQNGESLAKDLIKAGLLTKYQAEQILMGKGNGLRMGKYLIEAKLGAGGMGQVFKAQHAGMGRTVAIKVIHTKNKLDSQTIQRFDREVKAAARLIHPNVITVFDADHENSQHYMVMEYCEGKDLFAVVRTQGTCGIYDAIEYIMQAALGLQYAHEQGVIHRDIKPGNILLDKNKKIKIVDMGLARLQALSEEEKAPMLTATTAIMGTVDFMSPEQGLSTRNADARADIYSLGASLYYLLTGKVMYDGETAFAKLIAHRESEIPSLRKIRADAPEELDSIYNKMVAKNPEDRYQTMNEVIGALQALRFSSQNSQQKSLTQLKIGKGTTKIKPLHELETVLAVKDKKTITKNVFYKNKIILIALSTICIGGLIIFLAVKPKTPKSETIVSATEAPTTKSPMEQKETKEKKPLALKPEEIGQIDFQKEGLFLVAPFSEQKAKDVQNALSKRIGLPVESKLSLAKDVDLEMVLIPPGRFMMGSPESEEGRNPDETLHEVTITKPFLMGKYEVTRKQWHAVILTTDLLKNGEEKFPILDVVRNSCDEFIEKANSFSNSGKQIFRLPTEAEWEYACRSGTNTIYYFGNTIDHTQAGYNQALQIIGNFKPNSFGLYDMHGNASEWVADGYRLYDGYLSKNDPIVLIENATKLTPVVRLAINRGGNYKNKESFLRSANRVSYQSHRIFVGNRNEFGVRFAATVHK